jgi:hypothetical protein
LRIGSLIPERLGLTPALCTSPPGRELHTNQASPFKVDGSSALLRLWATALVATNLPLIVQDLIHFIRTTTPHGKSRGKSHRRWSYLQGIGWPVSSRCAYARKSNFSLANPPSAPSKAGPLLLQLGSQHVYVNISNTNCVVIAVLPCCCILLWSIFLHTCLLSGCQGVQIPDLPAVGSEGLGRALGGTEPYVCHHLQGMYHQPPNASSIITDNIYNQIQEIEANQWP